MSSPLLSPVRPQSAVCIGKRLLLALVPSFIADYTNPERRRRPTKLHATSYLDGLRGLAACAVFAYHYTDYNHKFFLPAYGYNTDNISSSIVQLPFIRLMYSGTPMVHIFFVISGFALSFRPLQFLYNPDSPSGGPTPAGLAKCHALLTSSAFRRPIRLFIPPLVVTAIAGTIVRLGYMNGFMKPQETLHQQLGHWIWDAFANVTWPWAWDEGSPRSKYNPHLWTIPMEFTHSMFLFLVILVVSRLRGPQTRQVVLVLVMTYCLISCRWAAFEFVGGAFLADMHLSRQFYAATEQELITPLPNTLATTYFGKGTKLPIGTIFRILKNIMRTFVLVTAGYILCWPPRKGDMVAPYIYIQSHAPATYIGLEGDKPERGTSFWLALAAFCTVWSCGRIRLAKSVLTSSVAQYAGRVSFCLYIFQHMVLNLLQHHVLGSMYKPATAEKPEEMPWGVRGTFGINTPLRRTVTWFTGLFILGSVLVFVADLFTRVLDGPAVRLSKWLESIFFARDEGREGLGLEKISEK